MIDPRYPLQGCRHNRRLLPTGPSRNRVKLLEILVSLLLIITKFAMQNMVRLVQGKCLTNKGGRAGPFTVRLVSINLVVRRLFMFENIDIPNELRPSDPRFGSGPSLVPVSFLKQLAETGHEFMGTSHRKPAVKNLVKQMQDGLRTYFNLPSDYEVVIGNGGATFLFDMIGLGLVEKSSIHYTCGEFSEKWFKSHSLIPWIETKQVGVEYGKGNQVENVKGHDMTCLTLNETSTGVQNSSIPAKQKGTLIGVDATSGAGQIPCDVSAVDLFFFSPQKVFASDGGFFVSIMSPEAIARALKLNETDRYIPGIMNWKLAIENSRKNQTYNTPSLATIFFLNEQIKLMNEMGSSAVYELAEKKANHIYSWAESKDYLSPYVVDANHRSRAVATIDVDDKIDVTGLLSALRAQKAVYDIDAYRKLGRNQFRVSLFHNIKLADLQKLTELLSFFIEK
jgi:phosphoserine aminotransferase